MTQETPLRKLRVDMGELEMAFENSSWETHYYLDRETGQVAFVDSEIRGALEAVYEEMDEADPEDEAAFEAALERADLPDWELAPVRAADEVERGFGERFVEVPRDETHDAYSDMEDFIPTVEDERLRNRLRRAMEGRGAFRRFKDELEGERRVRERWFAFRDARLRQRIVEWLREEGIEPIVEPSPEKTPEPPPREELIGEALWFVQQARQLPGVQRIALIGSLATSEPDPDDVDLLVTVADDMDLGPLATLGRKLAGHCQSLGRGGEVFLADPRGNYLGRTCPWRDCGPGIRADCDAEHCGRRPYLHDDLRAVRLARRLIAEPPIELWPQVVVRVGVPEDVRSGLLQLLQR